MEIKITLAVTKEEFHQFITQSLIQEASTATKSTVTLDQLQPGFKYKKVLKTKMGQDTTVKTKVVHIEPGHYEVQFNSPQGINTLSYKYDGDESIDVDYFESYKTDSKANDLNFKLMSWLFTLSNKKRIKRMLRAYENYIITNRTKGEE